MKTIAFFSTSRSEYGILKPLIKKLQKNKKYKIFFFIGGTHLNKQYGFTKSEIKNDKIKINDTFNYLDKNFKQNLSNSFARAIHKTNNLFKKYNFDYVCVLGDRLELLSILINSLIYNKKIIHIGGGDTTEGAIDNKIRDMISQASFLHLVLIENHKQKLIQMNCKKNSVFVVGSLAIDTIKKQIFIPKAKIFKKMSLNMQLKTVIYSFHPCNADLIKISKIGNFFDNILKLLIEFNLQIILTYPGFESESESIIKVINKYNKKKISNLFIFKSLGISNFNNILKYSDLIIGNSSSGIIEAPFHNVPTVNIGDRQKGRFFHKSIIDCGYNINEIKKSIQKSLKYKSNKQKYMYGNGDASDKIIKILDNKL